MIVKHLSWNLVTVDYDEKVGEGKYRRKKDVFTDAYVHLDPHEEGIATLSIRSQDDKHNLYLTKARLIKLNPWMAIFEAYYWGGEGVEFKLVRAVISCRFEDRE